MASLDPAFFLPSRGFAATADMEGWECSLSKRYPTLAGLGMIETEISGQPSASGSASPTSPPPQVGTSIPGEGCAIILPWSFFEYEALMTFLSTALSFPSGTRQPLLMQKMCVIQ
ncbi:MAG: hypothetical protein Q9179_004173, partial [Wetmoreana sp. 5 TL-2023]